ncbi:MAG: hypothetical protein HQK65_12565 [Desulfamplus sp.]|nr:hypothetical protein [Desulfamplus sp.]
MRITRAKEVLLSHRIPKDCIYLCVYASFIIYLLFESGIVSDDFSFLLAPQDKTVFDSVTSNFLLPKRPLLQLLYVTLYTFCSLENLIVINIAKIVYIVLAFYMIAKFFSIFLSQSTSFLASFLFIFFPTHDATTYWFISQYLTASIALHLYSYYLLEKEKVSVAIIFSFMASFFSYGSTPLALSLFSLCLFKNKYRKGLVVFILPNIIYIFYYYACSKLISDTVVRMPSSIDFLVISKNYIIQAFSFLDANLGPSLFFKIYYSALAIDPVSFVITAIFFTVLVLVSKTTNISARKESTDRHLLGALLILTLSSCGMFALTNLFPQLTFNLGNRVSIFGSLLSVYLIVRIPLKCNLRILIIFVLFISIGGVSTHWKQWHHHQMNVIHNIEKNKELLVYNENTPLYVSGNQYSKLGPFSHIEFFSESWVVDSVFKLAGHGHVSAISLNKRFFWDNGRLINKKMDSSIQLQGEIAIYDSERDKFFMLPGGSKLNDYIAELPDDKRHWLQLINNQRVNSLITTLMPRLKYAF